MVNPFDKFLNFGHLNLWAKKDDRAVGIDIGTSSVKVVQLRREGGRAILETYGEIAVGPYRNLAVGQAAVLTSDKLIEVLRDLCREANVTTNQASIAVPLSSSLLLIIEIPKVGEEMLPKVVPIESRKYIPVPISEVSLDWWVIPHPGSPTAPRLADEAAPKLEILVVAVHNSIVHQYQEAMKMMALEPRFFEVETFSALRSIFAGEPAATVVLDLGASTTKMTVVDRGVVRLSHTIGKGAQDITIAISRALGVDFAKAEEIKRKVGLVESVDNQEVVATAQNIVQYIFLEANKALLAYQERQRRSVSKVMLIGGGALLKGILELASNRFEVPVTLGTPFDKVESPAFLQNVLHEAGPGFAVAIGLALRHLQSLE